MKNQKVNQDVEKVFGRIKMLIEDRSLEEISTIKNTFIQVNVTDEIWDYSHIVICANATYNDFYIETLSKRIMWDQCGAWNIESPEVAEIYNIYHYTSSEIFQMGTDFINLLLRTNNNHWKGTIDWMDAIDVINEIKAWSNWDIENKYVTLVGDGFTVEEIEYAVNQRKENGWKYPEYEYDVTINKLAFPELNAWNGLTTEEIEIAREYEEEEKSFLHGNKLSAWWIYTGVEPKTADIDPEVAEFLKLLEHPELDEEINPWLKYIPELIEKECTNDEVPIEFIDVEYCVDVFYSIRERYYMGKKVLPESNVYRIRLEAEAMNLYLDDLEAEIKELIRV